MNFESLFDVLSDLLKTLHGRDIHDVYPEAAKRYDELNEILNSSLTKRQKNVVDLHCGLKNGKKYSFKEIAARYSVSEERIKQIFAKAMRDLHHPSRIRKFQS